MQGTKNPRERGKFSSNTVQLTVCRAGDRVADREKGRLNFLFAVLPMVMRGLPVPRPKRLYIVHDAAREARLHSTPFGRFNDPVGRPTERGLAIIP